MDLTGESPWRLSWRADPAVARLADGHYSRQTPGAAQFLPPGRCLVLKTPDRLAAWATSWPYAEYVQHAWPGAWVNSLFVRRGAPYLASDLIRWAVAHTRHRWPEVPEAGIITMIDPEQVEAKATPGYCYLMAGWHFAGITRERGYHVYQQLPRRSGRTRGRRRRMPEAVPAPGSQPALFDLAGLESTA